MYLPNYNEVKTKRRRAVSKNKLSEFETFKKNAPELPEFTCSHIDEVNDYLQRAEEKLESLRNMNSMLRDNAEFWKESCQELQHKLNDFREWQKNLKNIINEDIQ